jgi:uncharacterized protein YndB with AHSA1/START domain
LLTRGTVALDPARAPRPPAPLCEEIRSDIAQVGENSSCAASPVRSTLTRRAEGAGQWCGHDSTGPTDELRVTNPSYSRNNISSLRSADGMGVVRIEDRYDTDINDLWSALTDPGRLVRWLGEVEGDLRLGGEFRFHFFASGSEGTGRVEACELPRRLLLTMEPGQPDEDVIEVTLTIDGDQTILVWEERGMPLDQLAAYGAGIQIHAEDLAAHLAGRERCDAPARWNELISAYRDLEPSIG